MDSSATVLDVWRVLVDPNSTADTCQTALLGLPGADSFTFEADPSATPADLGTLDQGASLLLDAESPAAKAMARTSHVGVSVVSHEDYCLGIFNAKEAKVRRDPVVRACGLRAGAGGCTNTSHLKQKLVFTGKRLLIQVPSASRATAPAFFSMPYLTISESETAIDYGKITALKAPAPVWRTFLTGSSAALEQLDLGPTVKAPSLTISTDLPASGPGVSSEISPSSYELLSSDSKADAKLDVKSGGIHDVDLNSYEAGSKSSRSEYLAPSSVKPKVAPVKSDDISYSADDAVFSTPRDTVSAPDSYFQRQAALLGQEQERLAAAGAPSGNGGGSGGSSSSSSSLSSRSRRDSFNWDEDRPSPPADNSSRRDNVPPNDNSNGGSGGRGGGAGGNDEVMRLLYQQMLSSQAVMERRLLALEADNQKLRKELSKTKAKSARAMELVSSVASDSIEREKGLLIKLGTLKRELTDALAQGSTDELAKIRRDVQAMLIWRQTTDSRMGSLEMDLRDEDGLLLTQIRECKSAVAAGDLGSYNIAGYTFQNEESVLSFIQTLSGKNNYVCFLSMKELFALCGDSVSTLAENMNLHKATKSADFEDTYTARVNTAHAVSLPSVFARKATSGDSVKITWCAGFRSYAAFVGGLKHGGKVTVERQLRKAIDTVRAQIRRRLSPQVYPMQYAVANAMADAAFLAAFDLLDALSRFYFSMISAGLSTVTSWEASQEMLLRVLEECEMVACDSGEEDVDAGFIWASMSIANKVTEFQRFRWGEHPTVCSMILFSILERLGDDGTKADEAAAKEALEKCEKNIEAMQELAEKQKKDHELAANAVNQVKQLKEAIAKGDKK